MIGLLQKDFRVYRAAFIASGLLVLVTCLAPFVMAMLSIMAIFAWYSMFAWILTAGLIIAFLKKDLGFYRAARIAVLSVFIIYIVPFITALIVLSAGNNSDVPNFLSDFAMVGQDCTILMAAAFGGCAFAIERRDRSGDFLAMMPVPRWHTVGSKAILSAVAIVPLWVTLSTLVYFTGNRGNAFAPDYGQSSARDLIFQAYAFPATLILLVFGISWFFSTLTKSPSISASLGMASILLIVIVREQLHASDPFGPNVDVQLAACAALIGAVCFLAGTLIYTQRVSP
jgi:hypothetical protein